MGRSTTGSCLPDAFWILGLALFVYTVGLASGPGSLSALRRRGLTVDALVLAAIVAASLVAVAGHELLGLSAARATGTFAGGETNTPALAAAIEMLEGKAEFARLAAEPIVGYSLAYPLGVVLPLRYLVVWLVLRRERRRPTGSAAAARRADGARRARSGNARGVPQPAQRRIRQGCRARQRLGAAVGDAGPAPGNLLRFAVGAKEEVDTVVAKLGQPSIEEIELDRHDLDFRRVVVSSRAVASRRIGEFDLDTRFGACATRVAAATSTSSPIPTRSSSSAIASASSRRLRA